MQFQLLFGSGSTSFDQLNAAVQSSEALGGVKINLKSEPFDTLVATTGTCNAASHPAATCDDWQLQNYGYNTYAARPERRRLLRLQRHQQLRRVRNPQMDNLIHATEYGASSAAFFAYEDFAAKQLPLLWLPNASTVIVYKSNLAGITPLNPFSGTLNPEVWYYTKPAS